MSDQTKDIDEKNINPDQARYALMAHLNHTTRLYRDLLKIVIELRKLPTKRAGVFPKTDNDNIM